MEFPDLGKHCSVQECKQLDFLPVRCDACQKIFCKEHFTYSSHSCPDSYKKDNQVPVCPLCNIPIPVMKGESPDIKVGQHIDTDCQSDPAKEKRKIYKNKCAVKGCKQKELIPVHCDSCQKNFCLKHRHEQDHKCQGFQDSGRGISKQGLAAVNRFPPSGGGSSSQKTGPFRTGNASRPQQTPLSGIGKDLERERRLRQQGGHVTSGYQSGMSEDEAMARALALSMQEPQPSSQTQKTTQSYNDGSSLVEESNRSRCLHCELPTISKSTANCPTCKSGPGTRSHDSRASSQEDEDLALARALQQSEEEAARRRQPTTQRQSSLKEKCSLS